MLFLRRFFLNICFIFLFFSQYVYADFINGGFETQPTTPTIGTQPYWNILGWTSTGYLFTGYKAGLTLPPKSLADITLQPSTAAPFGINDIISGATQSLFDYFLTGATPTTTLKLPVNENRTAMINLRSVNAKLSVSGTSGKPADWTKYGKQATALSQQITIRAPDDISADGKVHVRFKAAPVLENPDHTPKQQPFYAIQINKITATESTPIYFQWSYAAQPGVPWKTLSTKGTNPGSNATYTYTDWQSYDIPFENNVVNVGDRIELVVLAAGCSPGGHDGHIYLDDVTTQALAGLIISATGPAIVNAGDTITYTYTYKNAGTRTVNGVSVIAHMPVTQNSAIPYETIFNDVSNPTTGGGACAYDNLLNIANCNIGTLTAGQEGTFTMTVNVPENWLPSYGPINNGNYPIQGTDVSPSLGNLVQTNILVDPTPPQTFSHLVVDVSGLQIDGKNPSIISGANYSGTYTCTNTAPPGTATATSATCEINNLPNGLAVTGCTISVGGGVWTQPADIPRDSTVTCTVEGNPVSDISREYDLSVVSEATNNTNSTTNYATMPFYIYLPVNEQVKITATLNGSAVLSPQKVCCGRPVIMYDLPIESDLPATYEIIETTGSISCKIGNDGLNYFVKIIGKPGTCTILGHKDDQISAPLVLQTT